jgi:hypothetical protein
LLPESETRRCEVEGALKSLDLAATQIFESFVFNILVIFPVPISWLYRL